MSAFPALAALVSKRNTTYLSRRLTASFAWANLIPSFPDHTLHRASRSSSGLGHRPFTAATRVRLPYGTPFTFKSLQRSHIFAARPKASINPLPCAFLEEAFLQPCSARCASHQILPERKCPS